MLDTLLDEYRVRAKSERVKAVLFEERDPDMMAMACGTGNTYAWWAVLSETKVSLFVDHDSQAQQRDNATNDALLRICQALDCQIGDIVEVIPV